VTSPLSMKVTKGIKLVDHNSATGFQRTGRSLNDGGETGSARRSREQHPSAGWQ